MADIEQMFHQVKIIDSDQPALSFLWRNFDTSRPPDTYQMTVAIFGAKCSPAIANYVLQRTAEEHCTDTLASRAAAAAAKRHFYMDDFLKSEESVNAAKTMQKSITELLAKGGFRLTKWVSSSPQVIQDIEDGDKVDMSIPGQDKQRALGCIWMLSTDTLGIQSRLANEENTKRGVLKQMALVFDPLGFVAPYILLAKMIIQSLWTLKYDWDVELQGTEIGKWKSWLSQLTQLDEVQIPRCYRTTSIFGSLSLCLILVTELRKLGLTVVP